MLPSVWDRAGTRRWRGQVEFYEVWHKSLFRQADRRLDQSFESIDRFNIYSILSISIQSLLFTYLLPSRLGAVVCGAERVRSGAGVVLHWD